MSFYMKNNYKLFRMTLAGFFLALAYVMPFLTGQIPELGSKLCPMHIPVLLGGFFCGWSWGLAIGFVAPLLRSLTLGMPPLFPTAVSMSLELATYGVISGCMYRMLPGKKLYVYCSLFTAMIVGRVVWGIAMLVCTGISGDSFTMTMFFAGAITNAIPGIIIQIILVPLLVITLDSSKIKD